MNVVIIRHGDITPPLDAEGNKLMYPTDIALNEVGRVQVGRLAMNLQNRGITLDRIYTSPYMRAVESATIIAKEMGITEIISHYELRDPDISGWIGRPTKEIENIDIYSHPRSEDQESYEHMIERMERVFNELYEAGEGCPFGVVSHGDPIQVLMRKLQCPEEKITEVPRMDVLRNDRYLKRGNAWKLIFNNQRVLEDMEHIGDGFQFGSPERAR